jgi:hypothetical protein
MPWNDDRFWPAFKRVGMLTTVQVLLPGCTEAKNLDVDWSEPELDLMTGMRSRDYTIEYQYADAPTLAEDCQVLKDGALYRVREAPFIPADAVQVNTGYFRRALLTKV